MTLLFLVFINEDENIFLKGNVFLVCAGFRTNLKHFDKPVCGTY